MTNALSQTPSGGAAAHGLMRAIGGAVRNVARIITCGEHPEVEKFTLQNPEKWHAMNEDCQNALITILNHDDARIRQFPFKHPDSATLPEEKIRLIKSALMYCGDEGRHFFDAHFEKIKDYSLKEIEITARMFMGNAGDEIHDRRVSFMQEGADEWQNYSEKKKICTFAMLSSFKVNLQDNSPIANAWRTGSDKTLLEYSQTSLKDRLPQSQEFLEMLPEK